MTEELKTLSKVELARRLYEAQEQRDNETIFAIYDEQIVWETPSDSPFPDRYEGHAGVRDFMRDWTGTWSDWHAEVESAHERGDRVLLIIHDRARVGDASALIERRYGHLFTFRERRIIHAHIYSDVDEAFRALGS